MNESRLTVIKLQSCGNGFVELSFYLKMFQEDLNTVIMWRLLHFILFQFLRFTIITVTL